MIIKEVLNHKITCSMDFLIGGQFFVVADTDCSEDELGELREDAVTVVFADGKVHVVASNHVQIQAADLLDMPPFAFVLIALDCFVAKAIPQGEQLDYVLCCFLKDDQPVDVPCVETDSVLSVHYEFSQELEGDKDDFIVCMEGIQCSFNNGRKVVWVEPIKEEIERLRVVAPADDSAKDVKKLHDILSNPLCSLHSCLVH